MCGICGYVHSDPGFSLKDGALQAMTDALYHRGPDDEGAVFGSGVGLGIRRLAVLDLSEAGHMPMSRSGRYQIVYNGEVFNYRELRTELEQAGYTFRSNSDTEVVLALYEKSGPPMLERLNGMFALAIWDTLERQLFLARDRVGIKPLYYTFHGGAFLFASEQKAFFQAGVRPQLDPTTLTELLCFRYVGGARTPFAGIKRLLPGHWLIWKDGQITLRRWWHLGERARASPSIGADRPRWLRETFDSAVEYSRISDVPVGVLLSGGLDSGSVAVSLARQAREQLASFTVRFADRSHDEGPLAQEVAAASGLRYHELRVDDDVMLDELKRASLLNDEPLAHGNDLQLLAISRYAKSIVTVLLSGEGADETLGGYVRYRPLCQPGVLSIAGALQPRSTGWRRSLPERLQKLSRFLDLRSIDSFVLLNSCDVLPNDLEMLGMQPDPAFEYRRAVLDEAKQVYPNEPVRQAMYSDQHTFLCSILDRNDRMTMGSSIECRVPFLDYRLVEGLAAVPTRELLNLRQGKLLLRRAVGDRLPVAVRRHPKWGFAVPWERYFRRIPSLREMLLRLSKAEPFVSGPFSSRRIDAVIQAFINGDDSQANLVWQLAMIAVWYEAVWGQSAKKTSHRKTKDTTGRDKQACFGSDSPTATKS